MLCSFLILLACLRSVTCMIPDAIKHERKTVVIETNTISCFGIDPNIEYIQSAIAESLNTSTTRLNVLHQESHSGICDDNHIISVSIFGEGSRFYYGPPASHLVEILKQQVSDGTLELGYGQWISALRVVAFDELEPTADSLTGKSNRGPAIVMFEILGIFSIMGILTCFLFASAQPRSDRNFFGQLKSSQYESVNQNVSEETGHQHRESAHWPNDRHRTYETTQSKSHEEEEEEDTKEEEKVVHSPTRNSHVVSFDMESMEEEDFGANSPHLTKTLHITGDEGSRRRKYVVYFTVFFVISSIVAVMFLPTYLYSEGVDLSSTSDLEDVCQHFGYPLESQLDKCQRDMIWSFKINSRSSLVNWSTALLSFAIVALSLWGWFVDAKRLKYYLVLFGVYFFCVGFDGAVNTLTINFVRGFYSNHISFGTFFVSAVGCGVVVMVLEVSQNDGMKKNFWRYVFISVTGIIAILVVIEFQEVDTHLRLILEKAAIVGNLTFASLLTLPFLFVKSDFPQIYKVMSLVSGFLTAGTVDIVTAGSAQHISRRYELYILITCTVIFIVMTKTYLEGFRNIKKIYEAMRAIYHVDADTGKDVYKKLRTTVPLGIFSGIPRTEQQTKDAAAGIKIGHADKPTTILERIQRSKFMTGVTIMVGYFLIIYVIVRIYAEPDRLEDFCFAHNSDCSYSPETCTNKVNRCSAKIALGIAPALDAMMLNFSSAMLCFFVFSLSVIHFVTNKDFMAFFGLSFLLSFVLETFHVMSSMHIIEQRSDQNNVADFSLMISRLIFSISLVFQASLLTFFKRYDYPGKFLCGMLKRIFKPLTAVWTIAALCIGFLSIFSGSIPDAFVEGGRVSRPFDIFSFFAFFLFAVLILTYRYKIYSSARSRNNVGSRSNVTTGKVQDEKYHYLLDGLTFCSIPLLWAQGYMAFASTENHDHWYNTAVFMKLFAAVCVCVGCSIDIVAALLDKARIELNLQEAVTTNAALAAYIYKREHTEADPNLHQGTAWKYRRFDVKKKELNFFEPEIISV